jgi:hypothetical protein
MGGRAARRARRRGLACRVVLVAGGLSSCQVALDTDGYTFSSSADSGVSAGSGGSPGPRDAGGGGQGQTQVEPAGPSGDASSPQPADDSRQEDESSLDAGPVVVSAQCAPPAVRPCSDDGFVGTCAFGEELCLPSGEWGPCSIQQAAADTCAPNNDDDCDGNQNEDCPCTRETTRACSSGGYSGTCSDGIQTCDESGAWSPCSIAPGTDTCLLGNDDDCDGHANEGCLCILNSTRVCGPCGDGEQECIDGRAGTYGPCSGGTAEQIYYLDADADGHASSVSATVCGAPPPSYIAGPVDDCCDSDGRVHPGAEFLPAGDGGCGRGGDFNCDGTTEPTWTVLDGDCFATCFVTGSICRGQPSPGCGLLLETCSCASFDVCVEQSTGTVVQQCR